MQQDSNENLGLSPHHDIQKGFTLIEVLIAIVLISIGLLSLMGIMSEGMYADKGIEYRITAMNLAREKIEQLKAVDYSLVTAGYETGSELGFDWINRRTVTVEEPYGANALKDITVTIDWVQKEQSQTITVETFLAEY